MTAKKRKAGILFKLAVAVFAIYVLSTFVSLQFQINSKKQQLTEINDKIAQENAKKDELTEILNAEIDEEYIEKIARSLGYVNPDERIYERITD